MKHSEPGDVRENWEESGFGLYVHWPFCAAKCPYCDFNSYVSKEVSHVQWAEAFEREILNAGAATQGRTLDSIFFGGGTPSLMDPQTTKRIIDAAQRQWTFRNSIEITLEANPSSVEYGKFVDFQSAGVNRISLGIQSLDDQALRRLGRLHSVETAQKAWDIANKVFDRASFDLIYARQNQSLKSWEAELLEAFQMNPNHLSLYQLTVEDGTAFGDLLSRGRLQGLPDEDLGADLYERTQDICNERGIPAYEISNHAVSGEESVHNRIYWRGGDFVGIGPGAHGRLTIGGRRIATVQEKTPAKWLLRAAEGRAAEQDPEVLNLTDQAREYLLMSMRMAEGTQFDKLDRLTPVSALKRKIQHLDQLGLVWQDGQKFGATPEGRPLLNRILLELLSDT